MNPLPSNRNTTPGSVLYSILISIARVIAPFIIVLNNIRKNLLRIYRRQKWQVSHLGLFPAALVYMEILLRLFTKTGLFKSLIYPLLFGLACGLLCAAITSAFKPKLNRIISIVILLVFGFWFTTECLIKNSYQVYMTMKAITTGAGGVMGGFASDLFRAIFKGIPKIFMFFLPAILYIGTGKRRMPARRYQLPFVGALLIAALLLQGIGVLGASHGANGAKYKGQYNFNTATQVFGLITSTRLESKYSRSGAGTGEFTLDSAEPSPSPSAAPAAAAEPSPSPSPIVYGDNVMDIDFDALNEETYDETLLSMNEYVQSLTPTKKNAYTGLFEGKNLILICAEAWSDSAVDEKLTPTMYRMMHNGFYFSEFYQPSWGGSTSTGEFSFLFGLVPLDGIDTILDVRYNNNYFTLGSQLNRLGYYSRAYHNGVYDFYDRDLTHTTFGYDEYLGYGNGLEELLDGDNSDTKMFETTMDTYLDHQPFSIYYMTLSGHCIYVEGSPYVTKYLSRVQEVFGSKYKDTTMYYFCYQTELENALTRMIEKLEEKGIADDTVIAMTGDHYPYGLEKSDTFQNSEDYVTDLYGYKYTNSYEQDHNGLIIWSGCLEHENKDMACEISAPTYSLDVVPTLSNLFGVEFDSRLLVGRDVFSDAEPIVLWNNYSWVTERGKFDSIEYEFTPNPGFENDEEYISRISSIVSNKITFSQRVVDNDYYGYLFGSED